jgi:hypothetical protein
MTSVSAGLSVVKTPHLGRNLVGSRLGIVPAGGLPGFENERHMIPVEIPAHRPLVFLQSTRAFRCLFRFIAGDDDLSRFQTCI